MQINTVSLVGRLGQDPEIKYFESGKVVTKFSIAVNNPFKKDSPDWFDIEVWGKTAEVAGQYCKKGSQVGIVGHVDLDRWNDRSNGALRSKTKIVADNLYLLDSKKDSQEQTSNDQQISNNQQTWEIDF